MAVPLPRQTETTVPSPPARPGPAPHAPPRTALPAAGAGNAGCQGPGGGACSEQGRSLGPGSGSPQRPEEAPPALLTSFQVLVRALLAEQQAAGPPLGPVAPIAGRGHHGERWLLGWGPKAVSLTPVGAGAGPHQGPQPSQAPRPWRPPKSLWGPGGSELGHLRLLQPPCPALPARLPAPEALRVCVLSQVAVTRPVSYCPYVHSSGRGHHTGRPAA